MVDQSNRHTLAEAARLTGLSVEAIRLRIRRGKLAAEKGNDGLRVILTSADIAAIVASQERQQFPTRPVDQTNKPVLLEDAVGLLRDQLAAREAELERVRSALEQAQAGRLEDRGRAERAEGEAEGLRTALRMAEAQAASLQADIARERATAQALLQAKAAERQAAEAAQAELAAWTEGGPLTRMLRAFFRRAY
jgi:hypothetical protein